MHCRRLKRGESALYKIELPEEKELTFYHTDVTLTLFILQINLFSYKQVTRTSCFISSMVYLHKTWKFFWEGWGGGGEEEEEGERGTIVVIHFTLLHLNFLIKDLPICKCQTLWQCEVVHKLYCRNC